MAALTPLTRMKRRYAFVFLLPMALVVLAVAAYPLARTILFSFTDAQLGDMSQYNFVGIENYWGVDADGDPIGVLRDPEWWGAVWNTISFTVVSVGLETFFGMIVALVLNSEFKGRGLVRTAVLVPWAIPTIVSAKMWAWMLHDHYGVMNDILMKLSIIEHPLAWTTGELSMFSVILVDVWKTTPFMALLILAALQMLPGDCYEAAKVDGISPVKVFFNVTLPLIGPAVAVAVIFRALDALRVFDLIYVLTSNSPSTMSMSVYARQYLVDFNEVGIGSAASTVLFFIIALCVGVYITLGRVRFDGEAAR